MKQNQILVIVLVAIIFAGGGFFGGLTYQKNQLSTLRGAGGNFAGRTGATNQAGGMMNARRGGQVAGEILSVDANSVTVKLADGSSKIVLLSTNTSIINSVEAKTSDIKVGSKVAIFGNTNTDGSVTAQNIQLNPINRGPNISLTK